MLLEAWVDQRPLLLLSFLFASWKGILLVVALLSPGIGYDTSTNLQQHIGLDIPARTLAPQHASYLIEKLVRWDAVYFTQMARDGHVFEQQWAFGIGISSVLSLTTRFNPWLNHASAPLAFAVGGIILSHFMHWLSVILLYHTAMLVTPKDQLETVPFVASALSIICPAGIFLSAPYAESTFAALNFLGFYLYLQSQEKAEGGRHSLSSAARKFLAGICFGLATVMRGNGLLSGIVFVMDLSFAGLDIIQSERPRRWQSLVGMAMVSCTAGSMIALGMAWPQYLAWSEYCLSPAPTRPWCHHIIPSIFAWVQSQYWNVGLFRYWSVSNLPLFLLASPLLFLLIKSAYAGLNELADRKDNRVPRRTIAILAAPQFALAILALTSYHVQIISRISSGYPWWYIWLAMELSRSPGAKLWPQFMVMYTLIQAALYASFLPPA